MGLPFCQRMKHAAGQEDGIQMLQIILQGMSDFLAPRRKWLTARRVVDMWALDKSIVKRPPTGARDKIVDITGVFQAQSQLGGSNGDTITLDQDPDAQP